MNHTMSILLNRNRQCTPGVPGLGHQSWPAEVAGGAWRCTAWQRLPGTDTTSLGRSGTAYIGFYKVLTNWFMGVELPPETVIGHRCASFTPMPSCSTQTRGSATVAPCASARRSATSTGSGPEGAPTLGDDVEIGAGAIVIGERQIGDGATIGAGAVVVADVAAGTVVVGNPAKPIRSDGVSPTD